MSAPKRTNRARLLGVDDAAYARLLAAQDGGCALCAAKPRTRRLHVDHDHKTGAVRGLLCHSCNRKLWRGVTVAWLVTAADYLARADERARGRVTSG